jgi:hypothetical protein
MIQQVQSKLQGLLTRLRVTARGRSVTGGQVRPPWPRWKPRRSAVVAVGLSVFMALPAAPVPEASAAADPNVPVHLVAGEPGLDEEDGTLFVALQIINEGTAVAANVQVRSIELDAATRITPDAFPVTLGDIVAGESAVLDASFTRNIGSVEVNTVSGPFPAEDIVIVGEGGEAAPPVPIGPFRGLVPTSPSAELLEPIVVEDERFFRIKIQ